MLSLAKFFQRPASQAGAAAPQVPPPIPTTASAALGHPRYRSRQLCAWYAWPPDPTQYAHCQAHSQPATRVGLQANPASVQQLVEMGFGEGSAQRALLRHSDNLNAAMDWLLARDSPPRPTPATPAARLLSGSERLCVSVCVPAPRCPRTHAHKCASRAQGIGPRVRQSSVSPTTSAGAAVPRLWDSASPGYAQRVARGQAPAPAAAERTSCPRAASQPRRHKIAKIRESAAPSPPRSWPDFPRRTRCSSRTRWCAAR